MRPETIIVETKNGPVLINKEDFDPAFHRLPDDNATDAAAIPADTVIPPAPVPAAPAAIDANGNPINAGDGGQMVPPTNATPPQTPNQSVSPPPVLLVTKNDKKRFVVVDMEQKAVTADGIDAEGYKTEKEAWDAINAHIAKLSGATA